MKEEPKTIRQAVFPDVQIRNIVDLLTKIPLRILGAKEAITECETRLKYDVAVADAKQDVADLETEVVYEVFNDLDKNGKKTFSNEEKRKAETRRRLLQDKACCDEYVRLCNIFKDALQAESLLKMDLGKAQARFAALEAENHNLRSIAAMIAGLAHESTTQERTHRHVATVRLGDNNHD